MIIEVESDNILQSRSGVQISKQLLSRLWVSISKQGVVSCPGFPATPCVFIISVSRDTSYIQEAFIHRAILTSSHLWLFAHMLILCYFPPVLFLTPSIKRPFIYVSHNLLRFPAEFSSLQRSSTLPVIRQYKDIHLNTNKKTFRISLWYIHVNHMDIMNNHEMVCPVSNKFPFDSRHFIIFCRKLIIKTSVMLLMLPLL